MAYVQGREKNNLLSSQMKQQVKNILGAVLFLASDVSSYITGQSIEVNGGFWFA